MSRFTAVFKELNESFLHVLFPHICCGCGNDIADAGTELCPRCINDLPATGFSDHSDNPVEKVFWGRIPLESATAVFYFTKESLMQHLLHAVKYKNNKDLGRQLGRLMGIELMKSDRFRNIDALVPVPLFYSKEKKRGYNQATVLCEGIAEVMKIEILHGIAVRVRHTDTQTKKGRIDRWENMREKFMLTDASKIANKNLLLVDDVVTTGATLEACGSEMLNAGNMKLSIATLCFASR